MLRKLFGKAVVVAFCFIPFGAMSAEFSQEVKVRFLKAASERDAVQLKSMLDQYGRGLGQVEGSYPVTSILGDYEIAGTALQLAIIGNPFDGSDTWTLPPDQRFNRQLEPLKKRFAAVELLLSQSDVDPSHLNSHGQSPLHNLIRNHEIRAQKFAPALENLAPGVREVIYAKIKATSSCNFFNEDAILRLFSPKNLFSENIALKDMVSFLIHEYHIYQTIELIELLGERGVDPYVSDRSGTIAADYLEELSDIRVVNALHGLMLVKGPESEEAFNKRRAVQQAHKFIEYASHDKMFEAGNLFESGFDINQKYMNSQGEQTTLLTDLMARFVGNPELTPYIHLLLDRQANPNPFDGKSNSFVKVPLVFAILAGDLMVFNRLIDQGAQVDVSVSANFLNLQGLQGNGSEWASEDKVPLWLLAAIYGQREMLKVMLPMVGTLQLEFPGCDYSILDFLHGNLSQSNRTDLGITVAKLSKLLESSAVAAKISGIQGMLAVSKSALSRDGIATEMASMIERELVRRDEFIPKKKKASCVVM